VVILNTADQQIVDPYPTLFDAISNAHPRATQCAAKIKH
jgi:hypothetical protein